MASRILTFSWLDLQLQNVKNISLELILAVWRLGVERKKKRGGLNLSEFS